MRLDVEMLTDSQQSRLIAGWEAMEKRVLPADWRKVEAYQQGGRFVSRDGLKVIVSTEIIADDSRDTTELWLHVSLSRPDRDPSYFDMVRVKEFFIGVDRKAIQVLPRREEHYNLHKHCLHVFACLDRDPLPDLRDPKGRL